VVDLAGEHARELSVANALLERGHLRSSLRDGRLVVPLGTELEQDFCVLDVAPQFLEAFDLLLQPGALARDGLGFSRVVPEAGRERSFSERFDLLLQLRKVKDAPLAP
jgi:hypothetical protein